MIIVHENLEREALAVAETFRNVFGLPTKIANENLANCFSQITAFNGFRTSHLALGDLMHRRYAGKRTTIVTPRDIYTDDKSRDDDWIIGYSWGNIVVLSTARMKCLNNKPSDLLEVPEKLYLKRLNVVAVHELGHEAVRAPHHQKSAWVNAQTDYEQSLGPHCTDNSCVMYGFVDIKTPPAEEGYLRIGTERRYDAGLDDIISRLYPMWFCDECLTHVNMDEKFI